MGLPQTPSPPHLYPQALQLKLYQAFIFSIPILFSIILFLLFYLFYLKRRASNFSAPPPILPRTLNQATPFVSLTCEKDLKRELKDKLPIVLFDEDLRARDSQCCVCLGEFEMKEELQQVPSCKHLFHGDCIHHWLQSNSTCPLCRCSVAPVPPITLGHGHPHPLPLLLHHQQDNNNPNQHHHTILLSLDQQQQEVVTSVASNLTP
uniref:RING-type E3 ubiquitin transferase n=1 Tax=Davidia involucrata TaxID=16924 RepID=A0A5B7B7R7_DAVIN